MNKNIRIIRIIINTIHQGDMHAPQLAALPTDWLNFASNDVSVIIENIPHIAQFTRANMSLSP